MLLYSRRGGMVVRRLAVGTAVALMVSGVLSVEANAETGAPAKQAADSVTVKKFGSADLKRASKKANQLAATNVQGRGRVKEHLGDAVRDGRLVDDSAVSVTELADPIQAGKNITLVWEDEKAPESLLYGQKKRADGQGDSAAIELQMARPLEAPARAKRGREVTGGSGYASAFNITNLIEGDHGCSTGWFAPQYLAEKDHKIVSCYQVLELDKTPVWVYNRWSLWTPAEPSIAWNTVATLDFDVRSRPWKGQEGKVKQLADWAPRNADMINKCDTPKEFTIEAASGPFKGTAKVNANTCREYIVDVTAGPGTSNTIAVNYIADSWSSSREGQMYVDVAGKYDAVDATVNVEWADYNYMEIGICDMDPCFFAPDANERWVKKDPGWN